MKNESIATIIALIFVIIAGLAWFSGNYQSFQLYMIITGMFLCTRLILSELNRTGRVME